jgi:hypothetical protein
VEAVGRRWRWAERGPRLPAADGGRGHGARGRGVVLAVALTGVVAGLLLVGALALRAGLLGGDPRLRLTWATTEPWPAEGGRTTVEMRVVVENDGPQATQSTTILWEPGFAGQFELVSTDPPPWRVRIDERGWGVMDTIGVVPGQTGTFRLLFAGRGPAGDPPRLMVVANGHIVIAETPAAVRLLDAPGARHQGAFERGPLAVAADLAAFVPADSRRAFPLATGVGLLLAAVVTGGGLVVARATAR